MAYGSDTSTASNSIAVDKSTSIGDVQAMKLIVGTSGSVTPIPSDASLGLTVNVSQVQGTVTVTGAVTNTPTKSSVATRTSVSASASSVQLLASNANRFQAKIYNDSSANLYIGEGSVSASTSNFTIKVGPGGYYESYHYTGAIQGIWDSATGSARITENT